MTKLTDTQTIILTAGAQRPVNLAMPLPKGLHGAAAKMAVAMMISHGWLKEVDASSSRGEPLWREIGDGHGTTLVVTDAGLLAIGVAPVVAQTMSAVREHAAEASALKQPTPRAGTKQAMLIALLQAPEGATMEAIIAATGSVRQKFLEVGRAVAYWSRMTRPSPFRYFKTSLEIIRLAVMLYIRYPLSLHNVEDLLHQRGIEISHETVRFWWNRFGPMFAAEIRRRRIDRVRSSTHWKWHLDEVLVKVNGVTHYLWRAVVHEGAVLESFVSKKRDRKAALKFLRKSMKRHGRPTMIVTDKLRSYGAGLKNLGMADDREMGRWLNNRAENSHLPFRRRERAMRRFRRMRSLQKFVIVHSSIHNHFNTERPLYSRDNFKANRTAALAEWRQLFTA